MIFIRDFAIPFRHPDWGRYAVAAVPEIYENGGPNAVGTDRYRVEIDFPAKDSIFSTLCLSMSVAEARAIAEKLLEVTEEYA